MSVIMLLFGAVFAFLPLGIIGLVVFLGARGVRDARARSAGQSGQPAVFSVPARILARRAGARQEAGMRPAAPAWHVATFEFQNGERLELPVSGADFDLLVEGDYGTLTFAGRKYLGFVRDLQTPGMDGMGTDEMGTGRGASGQDFGRTGMCGQAPQAQPSPSPAENRVMTMPPEA